MYVKLTRLAAVFFALHLSAVADESPPAGHDDWPPELGKPRDLDKEATSYFKMYLNRCPEGSIRCLWFGGSRPRVGMVLSIDVEKRSVLTGRDVYEWAFQAGETHTISSKQQGKISKLISSLPPSTDEVNFHEAVHIAYWKEGEFQIASYRRMDVPLQIQRLFDLAGGESEFIHSPQITQKGSGEIYVGEPFAEALFDLVTNGSVPVSHPEVKSSERERVDVFRLRDDRTVIVRSHASTEIGPYAVTSISVIHPKSPAESQSVSKLKFPSDATLEDKSED
jgi:hypothetical protein